MESETKKKKVIIPREVLNPSIEQDLDSPSPLKQVRGLDKLRQSMRNYLKREPSLREMEYFLKEHKPTFPRKSREAIRKAITNWNAIENEAIREAIENLEKELKDNPYLDSYELARIIHRTVEEAIKKAIELKIRNSKKDYPLSSRGCQEVSIDINEEGEKE